MLKCNVCEFNYFKVNEKILELEELKKSELWVYLTHCRHRGEKSKGYSIAGITAVQEHFGKKINKKTYDKCIDSLVEKGLIEVVSTKEKRIYTGSYKIDKAVGIVEPKDTINIQLPYEMLDNKIMAEMTVEEIKTVIELYKNYNIDKSLDMRATEGLVAIKLEEED